VRRKSAGAGGRLPYRRPVCDVQLSDRDDNAMNRCATIASRAKEYSIDFRVIIHRMVVPRSITPLDMRAATGRILLQHGHHIASLELNFDGTTCGHGHCTRDSLPIFKDVVRSGSSAGMDHLPPWGFKDTGYIHFSNLRTMKTVELRVELFPCAMRFLSVTDVRLVSFGSVQTDTLERVCMAFPGITSLSINAYKLPYFGNERLANIFAESMARIQFLSVKPILWDTSADSMVSILRSPVPKIELYVSTSTKEFARRALGTLRELLTAGSVLAIRSIRQREATGEWIPKYYITVRPAAGREITLVLESFTSAINSYFAPLLREKQLHDLAVDGHDACALLYAACGTAYLSHITKLRVIVGEPTSFLVPQKRLRLGGLKELVLEKDPMRGSRVTVATLLGLVSKPNTNGRISLRLQDVYVYADGRAVC